MSGEFCLVRDDDCHWYVIPVEMKDDFDRWKKTQAHCEDWDGHDFNENRIDGPHRLVFKTWREE